MLYLLSLTLFCSLLGAPLHAATAAAAKPTAAKPAAKAETPAPATTPPTPAAAAAPAAPEAPPVDVTATLNSETYSDGRIREIYAKNFFTKTGIQPSDNLFLIIHIAPDKPYLWRLSKDAQDDNYAFNTPQNKRATRAIVATNTQHLADEFHKTHPLPAKMREVLETPGTRKNLDKERVLNTDGPYSCYQMGNLVGWFTEVPLDKLVGGQRVEDSANLRGTIAALPPYFHCNANLDLDVLVSYTPTAGGPAKIICHGFGIAYNTNHLSKNHDGSPGTPIKAYFGFGPDLNEVTSYDSRKTHHIFGAESPLIRYTDAARAKTIEDAFNKKNAAKIARKNELKSVRNQYAPGIHRGMSNRTYGGRKYKQYGLMGNNRLESFIFLFYKHINSVSSSPSKLGFGKYEKDTEMFRKQRKQSLMLLIADQKSNPTQLNHCQLVKAGDPLPKFQHGPGQPIALGYGDDMNALVTKTGPTTWKFSKVRDLYGKDPAKMRASFEELAQWKAAGKPAPPVAKAPKGAWYKPKNMARKTVGFFKSLKFW